MKAWEAIKIDKSGNHREVDTVFFDDDCDAQYVFDSLVNHDGMMIDYVQSELDSKGGIVHYEVYPPQD